MIFDLPVTSGITGWPAGSNDVADDAGSSMTGDLDIRTTYAAVGEALSRWEEFELALARLYARFAGYPNWLDKTRHFGACNPTFDMRIDAISLAAERFFATRSGTAATNAFRALCREAALQSAHHSRIAQGLVRNIAGDSDMPRFALELPWHAHDRLRLAGSGSMGSRAILEASEAFLRLALQTDALDQLCAALAG